MTQEEKAKAYDKALERAKDFMNGEAHYELKMGENIMCWVFPELRESEDEKMRKWIIAQLEIMSGSNDIDRENMILKAISWLEKQGDTNETINRDEFAQGVLRGAAINLITWIDYNSAEGSMCLSNMECKDIEGALVSGDWAKIYAYIKKKLEKQGEQKPAMVEPKFKVGDIIRLKDGDGLEWTVEKVLNNGYYTIVCADRDDFIQLDDKWELIGQKPAWSEEDKNFMYDTLSNLTELKDRYGEGYGNVGKCIDWVKSLKQRIGG